MQAKANLFRTLVVLPVVLLVAVAVALFGMGIRTAETQTPPPPKYEVQDLGDLGNSFSSAYGINDFDKVVGRAYVGNGYNHAYLYDGTMHDLGTLAGGSSTAYDINDFDKVVGQSSNSSNGYDPYHAFLYDSTNGMKDLGTLGGSSSEALSINDSDRIVGQSSNSNGYNHAFLKESGKPIEDLGTLGGSSSGAFGINNSDKVVGYAYTSSGSSHAFLKESGKPIEDLGTLGGSSSGARGINDFDKVVGQSSNSNGYDHAFLYDGTMHDLGTLGVGNYSYANSINNSGKVVGTFKPDSSPSSGISHGFLYDCTNGMQDLNSLIPADSGWTIEAATQINSAGKIAATGYKTAGDRREKRALLVTPSTTLATPQTPCTPDLDPASDSGASNTDNLTNDVTPTFTGTADEGSTVKIYVDGAEMADPGTATGGNYSVTTRALEPGEHSINATASNELGESEPSEALTITIDNAAPNISGLFSTPADGATYKVRQEVVADYRCTDEGGSGIWSCTGVDLNTATNTQTNVASGSAIDTSASQLGQHQFTVTAEDNAGNTSTETHTYNITRSGRSTSGGGGK